MKILYATQEGFEQAAEFTISENEPPINLLTDETNQAMGTDVEGY